MRNHHDRQTAKLKNAILTSKLAEQQAKVSSAVMTEDDFKAKLSAMSHSECNEYVFHHIQPPTPVERAQMTAALIPALKHIFVELSQDVIEAWEHDVRSGNMDREAFFKELGLAMSSDWDYRDFLRSRGVDQTLRDMPGGAHDAAAKPAMLRAEQG